MPTFYTIVETNNVRYDADIWNKAFATADEAKAAILVLWGEDEEIVLGEWEGDDNQQVLITDDSVVWITKTTVG